MISYTLRKAEEKDFNIIYEIKLDAMKEYITQTWGWDNELQKKFHAEEMKREDNYIIEIDSKPIGIVGINEQDCVVIGPLYLFNKYQSKGIGTKIITDIIGKNKTIKLGVLKVNNRARALYEKLGFETYGEENSHWKMQLIQ